MDQLKTQLATALEVKPSDIMDYRKEPQKQPVEAADDTYTVVLTTYQKFTAVQPADGSEAASGSNAANGSNATKSAIRYPQSAIPHGLQSIYASPMRGSKTQLLQLVEALNLDPGSKPTKKSLVALIEQSKTADSPESANLVARPGQSVPRTDHMQAHDATEWSEDS